MHPHRSRFGMKQGLSLTFALLLSGQVVAGGEPPPPPTMFVVDRVEDADDTSTGDGQCIAVNIGGCTLRAAIREANEWNQPITIVLGVSVTLARIGADEDVAETGDLDIYGDITISAAQQVRQIAGASIDRVFDVHPDGRLRLDGVTVTGGEALGNQPLPAGGGILVRSGARLELYRSSIQNSSAYAGGAIYSLGDTQITESRFSKNWLRLNDVLPPELVSGSAILSVGTLEIASSTFQKNGSQAVPNCGTCTIDDAVVHVMDLYSLSPTLLIRSSTIADNDLGVLVQQVPTTIVQSTIAGNLLGGIRFEPDSNQPGATPLEVMRSVLVGNGVDCTFEATTPQDLFMSGGRNASGDTSCGFDGNHDLQNIVWPFVNAVPSTFNEIDAPSGHRLPILMPNPYRALVDATGLACAGTDQRGVTRPQDGDLDGDAYCDIGAVEYRAGIDPLPSQDVFRDGFEDPA